MSEKDRTQGRKFLTENLKANIGRGRLRFQSYILLEFKDFNKHDYFPAGRYDINQNVFVEESVDISLRESDFSRLLDMLGYFQHNGNGDFYKQDLEQRLAVERSLRDNHPALKKAYNRYRILLDMVRAGKDIED